MRPFRYCFLTVQHESGWFPRLESPDSGMSRDFLCGAAGTGCLRARTVVPRPSRPAEFELYAGDSACGQGLRTGAHLRCFPSRRCAAGPSRSRSHGRLRRPKSLPIRHSSAAAQCLTPLGCRDCHVLTSWLHRFASLDLKSRIDARFALVLASWLHRFASLGLKSRINARFLPRMAPRLQRFASLGLKSRIDAALSCRQVEWPAYGRTLPLR